jgi:hypothetical protein
MSAIRQDFPTGICHWFMLRLSCVYRASQHAAHSLSSFCFVCHCKLLSLFSLAFLCIHTSFWQPFWHPSKLRYRIRRAALGPRRSEPTKYSIYPDGVSARYRPSENNFEWSLEKIKFSSPLLLLASRHGEM